MYLQKCGLIPHIQLQRQYLFSPTEWRRFIGNVQYKVVYSHTQQLKCLFGIFVVICLSCWGVFINHKYINETAMLNSKYVCAIT